VGLECEWEELGEAGAGGWGWRCDGCTVWHLDMIMLHSS